MAIKYLNRLKSELETFTVPDFDVKKGDVVQTKRCPTVFIRANTLHVSGEDGGFFVDYYGEYRGGDPWIDPRLENWANMRGYYWEWDNPGSISLWEK